MAASPLGIASGPILEDFGYSAHRAPPYGKRFNGAELWWGEVKNFYRFAQDAERWGRVASSIARVGMGRTSAREAAGRLSRERFSLTVSGRQRHTISRVDSDIDAALRRWGIEKADA